MPLRVGRRLAQLQQRRAAPIEPASLRLILDNSPLSSSTWAEELWVEMNTNLDPNLPSRASREIKIHVYLKRQTSDSSWEFLRIENKRITPVPNDSYGWNWHKTTYFCVEAIKSKRTDGRAGVLSRVYHIFLAIGLRPREFAIIIIIIIHSKYFPDSDWLKAQA